jgi:dihydrofolate reductase
MRKVTSGLFISLDGVTEEPSNWQFEFDADMGAAMADWISGTDTLLLGRVTYQYWNQYWPTATQDQDFARFINSTPKYVVSTTLKEVTWGDWKTVNLVTGNLVDAIARLKQQPGKNISVSGSPGLALSLLQQGLLDELTLFVHPVIAGGGKRFFKADDALKRLTLVSAKATSSGCAILTYHPFKG